MIKSQKDFYSGLLFTAFGTAFVVGAQNYGMGTAAKMGPGFFPTMLGIILALIGLVVLVGSFTKGGPDGDKIGTLAVKPLFFIIAANLLFGVMIGGLPSIGLPAMGLIVGIYVLVLVASFAGDQYKVKEVLVLATVLAAGSYLAFIKLLKLTFPIWPAFINA
jgi:Tripartite tricarboxylate transporter TctB family